MGLMDFFTSAADAVKDGDITDLMNGGLIGNKIMRDQKLALQQAESRKKPGKLCDSQCPVNDMRCEACLKRQQDIISDIEALNVLEVTINSLKEQSIELPKNCSLCGAPIEKGEKECPYCGTEYPAMAMLGNLPKTDLERDKMLLDASTETFAKYTELYKNQMEYKKENLKLPGILKGFTNIIASNVEKGMTMNAAMIKQGANDNGVSYPVYIAGVMTGQYQSVAMINMMNQWQQQHEIMEADRLRQEEYRARSRQIEMDRQAKLKAIRDEQAARQREIAKTRVPQYSGGPSRTCYNCTYYSAGAKACAQNGRSTNAGDYCGCWSPK